MEKDKKIINAGEIKKQRDKEDAELLEKMDDEMNKYFLRHQLKGTKPTWNEVMGLLIRQQDDLERNLHHVNPRLIKEGYVSANPKRRKLGMK